MEQAHEKIAQERALRESTVISVERLAANAELATDLHDRLRPNQVSSAAHDNTVHVFHLVTTLHLIPL